MRRASRFFQANSVYLMSYVMCDECLFVLAGRSDFLCSSFIWQHRCSVKFRMNMEKFSCSESWESFLLVEIRWRAPSALSDNIQVIWFTGCRRSAFGRQCEVLMKGDLWPTIVAGHTYSKLTMMFWMVISMIWVFFFENPNLKKWERKTDSCSSGDFCGFWIHFTKYEPSTGWF